MSKKYRNKTIEYDGFKFASLLEGRRYCYLIQCQQDGLIRGLVADKKQLRYVFHDGGREIVHDLRPKLRKIRALYYEADFQYLVQMNGELYTVWEDVKGETGKVGKRKPFMTATARFKMSLFRLHHLDDKTTILRICTRPQADPCDRDGYWY